jgi:hypothetical protein
MKVKLNAISSKIDSFFQNIQGLRSGEIVKWEMQLTPSMKRGCNMAEPTVITYPLPAVYKPSDSFMVQAGRDDVPVVSYLTEADYDYAHFSFAGTVPVTITACEDIRSFQISPAAFNIRGTSIGNCLTFELSESRYLILKINDLKELVILADPLEVDPPQAEGPGIYHVVDGFGADPTGAGFATEAIQNAIDSAHQAGGGTVYVPEGLYKTGNLTLRSHVELYLAGGAVLRGSGLRNDYSIHFHKQSLKMDGTYFIQTEPGSSCITIRGRGTIDANGSSMRDKEHFLSNLIVPCAVNGFVMEGVICRDSGLWAVIPSRSRDISITNYKQLNSLWHHEIDSIDIMESQNVVVRHAIAISEDDPYSCKTWDQETDICVDWPGSPGINDGILFEDTVAWTHCAAFKIGMGVVQAQHNVTFRNGYVYQCGRAVAIDHKYGNPAAENIVFENIDVERVGARGGNYWLELIVQEAGRGNGPVRGVTVRNVNVRDKGDGKSQIFGYSADSNISDVIFEHVIVEGKLVRSFEELHAEAEPPYVDCVVFKPER